MFHMGLVAMLNEEGGGLGGQGGWALAAKRVGMEG